MLKLTYVCVVIFAVFSVAVSQNTTVLPNTTYSTQRAAVTNTSYTTQRPSTEFPTTRPPCDRCELRCCGKYYTCASNCSGYPCDDDNQCPGGCCISGNCTESCSSSFKLTPLQVGLVAGGSALALSLACTCTCKCVSSRRKRGKQSPNVVVIPMPMHGNMQQSPPHEIPMGVYHASTPPGNPSAGINYGYQAKFDKKGRANR